MEEHRHDMHQDGPLEIALVGDLTENELDLTEKLLSVPPGAECTMYIDSPGGSPYCAMSLVSLILLRRMQVTGIVTGECSSAALWPFAACTRRLVSPYSVLLFHSMKWQSEEHVGLAEAAEWARHFGQLERNMDRFLGQLFAASEERVAAWIADGRYVSGPELVETGLAELVDFRRPGLVLPKRTTAVAKPRKARQSWREAKQVAHSGRRRPRS
jgi:ATP-dependent protease ClpP protease subunit